ncbi:hypothetical protein HG1285_17794 [Hydrogenivirga sp. 128-5-R1-1]|nr:hypothetical protein HG1285_17794 [Hydrogenivirga sp. 128-5-R1-1]
MVERLLPKQEVAGSSPVARFTYPNPVEGITQSLKFIT